MDDTIKEAAKAETAVTGKYASQNSLPEKWANKKTPVLGIAPSYQDHKRPRNQLPSISDSCGY